MNSAVCSPCVVGCLCSNEDLPLGATGPVILLLCFESSLVALLRMQEYFLALYLTTHSRWHKHQYSELADESYRSVPRDHAENSEGEGENCNENDKHPQNRPTVVFLNESVEDSFKK